MKFVGILIFIALIFSSCNNQTTNPVDPNSKESYYPVSIGSTWHYEGFDDLGNTSFDIKVIKDTTINGKKYSVFQKSKSGQYVSYAREENHITYELVKDASQNFLEVKTIDPNLSEESTWTYDFSQGNSNFTSIRTLKKTNQQIELDTKEIYNDVIIITLDIYNKGSNTKLISYQYYFAKGIGLIFAKIFENGKNTEQYSIISHTVK
jgi:hypothetical protein